MKARFAIALAAWPMLLQAQDASSVRASLEPQRIRIGEHAVISITAPADDPTVQWPTIADTLNAHIEVIGTAELDTAASGQGASMLVRRITITSFDTGYWAIPPFQLKAGGKSLETEPLLLQVDGFPVDAASVPADIKPIHRLPFSPLWWAMQHWTWIAGALATALLVALIVFLVRRTREPAQEAIPQEARVELHQRVLAQLDALEQERLWQQGLHKPYQSRLTDLLRGYIEERYQVPALERTTDELLHELRVSPLSSEHQALLGNMLRAADMVKFAKALPGPQENEQLMASARRFVIATASSNHAQPQA